MPSIRSSAAAVAALLLSLSARAQYSIDPTSVPLATRSSWCQSQLASCPLLCLQLSGESATTSANDCDPATLTYDCTCGNGLSPNASEFSQTIPYFICTEYGTECVAACNGDSTCQEACRADHPCGAQNPTRVNTTSSSMTATATTGSTSSGAVVYTGLGGAAATTAASSSSNSKSDSQAALDIGRSFGVVIVCAGVFAGFAIVM